MSNILKRCVEVGCDTADDVEHCVDCIETIVKNLHDQRRDAALLALREIKQTHTGGQRLLLRVQGLLAKYGHAPFKPDKPYPDPKIIDPMEKWWEDELDSLCESPRDDEQINQYCDAFLARVETYFNGINLDKRRLLLPRRRDFLARVYQELEQNLSPYDRRKLKWWIAEARLINCQVLLSEAQQKRTQEDWDEVSRCAEALRDEVESDEQRDLMNSALKFTGEYRHWHQHFESVLAILTEYEFTDKPKFSWKSISSSNHSALSFEGMSGIVMQLDSLGSTQDHLEFKNVLSMFTDKGLEHITGASSEIKVSLAALQFLKVFQDDWPEFFDAMPNEEVWKREVEHLRGQLVERVDSRYKLLRQGYESHDQAMEALINDPELTDLQGVSSDLNENFLKELRLLDDIEKSLTDLCEIGQTDALNDGRLEKFTRDLGNLKETWGGSKGFISLDKQLTHTQNELQRLHNAKRYIESWDVDAAFVELGRCSCLAATKLQKSLKQSVRIVKDAKQQINEIESTVEFYPLLDRDIIDRLQHRIDTINAKLKRSALKISATNRLSQTLMPLEKGLAIHRACNKENWKKTKAEFSLLEQEEILGYSVRRQLKAVVRTSIFNANLKGNNKSKEWLEICREYPDVLLKHADSKGRYLELLRHCPAENESRTADVRILDEYIPEEKGLSLLLACFEGAMQVDHLTSDNIEAEGNSKLLSCLLASWSKTPAKYFALRQLWELLPVDTRSKVWQGKKTPLMVVKEYAKRRLEVLKRELADSKIPVRQLKEESDDLLIFGLVQESEVEIFDVAVKFDQHINALNQLDPWGDENTLLLSEVKRDLESFSIEVQRTRGWLDTVKKRQRGVTAWNDIDEGWRQFRQRFDSLNTIFVLDTDPWEKFLKLLDQWLITLRNASDMLNWDLLGASSSQPWNSMRKNWEQSPEGVLWCKNKEICIELRNTSDLLSIYDAIKIQIIDFSELHKSLLESDVSSVLSPEKKQSLNRLFKIKPLCRPVDDISHYLINQYRESNHDEWQRANQEQYE